MIYLDYQATTPVAAEVAEAMRPWIEEKFAVPAEFRIFVLHHHLLGAPWRYTDDARVGVLHHRSARASDISPRRIRNTRGPR